MGLQQRVGQQWAEMADDVRAKTKAVPSLRANLRVERPTEDFPL